MATITHKRFLKEEELSTADVFTVVWDKAGNKFFKLVDQDKWANDMLQTVHSRELAKKRVRLYTL